MFIYSKKNNFLIKNLIKTKTIKIDIEYLNSK